MTPSDHMSTSVPYMCPFRISGATYHGEPQSVTNRPVSVLDVDFAKPKSAASHTSATPTDFDVAGARVHEDVLRLQIAVRDVQLVAVAHRLHQRLEHRARLVLVVELLLHDLVEELAAYASNVVSATTVDQLCHDVVALVVLVEALQPHDVFVVQLSHDQHLVLQRRHIAWLQVALLDALHRIPLPVL